MNQGFDSPRGYQIQGPEAALLPGLAYSAGCSVPYQSIKKIARVFLSSKTAKRVARVFLSSKTAKRVARVFLSSKTRGRMVLSERNTRPVDECFSERNTRPLHGIYMTLCTVSLKSPQGNRLLGRDFRACALYSNVRGGMFLPEETILPVVSV